MKIDPHAEKRFDPNGIGGRILRAVDNFLGGKTYLEFCPSYVKVKHSSSEVRRSGNFWELILKVPGESRYVLRLGREMNKEQMETVLVLAREGLAGRLSDEVQRLNGIQREPKKEEEPVALTMESVYESVMDIVGNKPAKIGLFQSKVLHLLGLPRIDENIRAVNKMVRSINSDSSYRFTIDPIPGSRSYSVAERMPAKQLPAELVLPEAEAVLSPTPSSVVTERHEFPAILKSVTFSQMHALKEKLLGECPEIVALLGFFEAEGIENPLAKELVNFLLH